MNPYLLIRQFFNTEKQAVGEPYKEFEPIVPEKSIIQEPVKAGADVLLNLNQEPRLRSTNVDLPDWLRDEEQLRDEGVIFGLTDANADEKIKIIESVFAEKAAADQKKVELLSERIGEYNLKLAELESKIESKQQKVTGFSMVEALPHQLPKTAISLSLSAIMALGNFFLIDFVFEQAFPVNHLFISAGVFLAGMFTLFSGMSVLHFSEENPGWLQWVKELALPLSASVFVWTIAANSLSPARSFGLFLFVLSLFLYSGKLFLDNLVDIKSDFSAWRHNRAMWNDQKKSVNNLEEEIEVIRSKMDELRIEKWKIIPELSEAEGRVNSWIGQRDSLIHLFDSEFKLARSYRDKLSQTQIKSIVDNG